MARGSGVVPRFAVLTRPVFLLEFLQASVSTVPPGEGGGRFADTATPSGHAVAGPLAGTPGCEPLPKLKTSPSANSRYRTDASQSGARGGMHLSEESMR